MPKSPRYGRPPFLFHPVPQLWPGSTIVCIASGPSLTQADVDYVREKARVIVINRSYEKAMWADVLYACDRQVWKWYWEDHHSSGVIVPGIKRFSGLKFALTKDSRVYPGVHVLQNTGSDGLERKPNGLRTGRNSGYQAINLAVHLGAARVILLGYDMQRTGGKDHHHEDHPNRSRSPYPQFRQSYQTIVAPLKAAGVDVINCTRSTALDCFPTMALEDALPARCTEAVA